MLLFMSMLSMFYKGKFYQTPVFCILSVSFNFCLICLSTLFNFRLLPRNKCYTWLFMVAECIGNVIHIFHMVYSWLIKKGLYISSTLWCSCNCNSKMSRCQINRQVTLSRCNARAYHIDSSCVLWFTIMLQTFFIFSFHSEDDENLLSFSETKKICILIYFLQLCLLVISSHPFALDGLRTIPWIIKKY